MDDSQGSIDIVLRRFAEHHDLEGAFSRRALTERAKGIAKLADVAGAVVQGQPLLPKLP